MKLFRRFIAIVQATALHILAGPAFRAIARQAKQIVRLKRTVAQMEFRMRRYRRHTVTERNRSRVFRLQIWRSLDGKN